MMQTMMQHMGGGGAGPFGGGANPFGTANPLAGLGLLGMGGAGMGGAGFPTAVKLNPGPARSIETLLVNGTECEPYITADDTLMQCQADELIEGAQILAHIVSAESILIGIEDNKQRGL